MAGATPINDKGYSIIYRFVMMDPCISLDAKGIFAYLTSYSSETSLAFPKRDRILEELQISKPTYHKHMRELTDKGYVKRITVINKETKRRQFMFELFDGKNVKQEKIGIAYDDKQFTVKADGYGFLSKRIMQDKNISVKAKGLYAFFCSIAGTMRNCKLPVGAICATLNISQPSYHLYLKELVNAGYVGVRQLRKPTEGRNGNVTSYYMNEYCLYDFQYNTENGQPDQTKQLTGEAEKPAGKQKKSFPYIITRVFSVNYILNIISNFTNDNMCNTFFLSKGKKNHGCLDVYNSYTDMFGCKHNKILNYIDNNISNISLSNNLRRYSPPSNEVGRISLSLTPQEKASLLLFTNSDHKQQENLSILNKNSQSNQVNSALSASLDEKDDQIEDTKRSLGYQIWKNTPGAMCIRCGKQKALRVLFNGDNNAVPYAEKPIYRKIKRTGCIPTSVMYDVAELKALFTELLELNKNVTYADLRPDGTPSNRSDPDNKGLVKIMCNALVSMCSAEGNFKYKSKFRVEDPKTVIKVISKTIEWTDDDTLSMKGFAECFLYIYKKYTRGAYFAHPHNYIKTLLYDIAYKYYDDDAEEESLYA